MQTSPARDVAPARSGLDKNSGAQDSAIKGEECSSRKTAGRSVRALQLALCFSVLVSAAGAQISPGALSRPHQSLNGSTNCASCHTFGGQAVLKCLACHTEIATRLNARHGLHASYNIPANSSHECARCHSEHNGEDFPLIKWDIKTFDHRQTGYILEGKHAGLSCPVATIRRISARRNALQSRSMT